MTETWQTVRMGTGHRREQTTPPVFIVQRMDDAQRRAVVSLDGTDVFVTSIFTGGELSYLENDVTGIHAVEITADRILLPNNMSIPLTSITASELEKPNTALARALHALVRRYANTVAQWTNDVNARIESINALIGQLSTLVYSQNSASL